MLLAIYQLCLSESALLIDDLSLISIPQILGKMDFALLRTLFTPGFHIDFYPVRDLAYWAEIHILGADRSCVDMTVYRLCGLSLFFVQLLLLARILQRRMTSGWGVFLAVLIYGLHPIHAESLMWVSAQKDLLALVFGLAAADQVDVLVGTDSSRPGWRAVSAILFFGLSLMSKGSFALLPIAFLFGVLLDCRRPERRKVILATALLLVLMGLGWSALQSVVYGDINDMRLHYGLAYRIQSSAAALGKELAGLVCFPVNVVDVENWGSWFRQNRVFLPIGVAGWLSFAGFFTMAALRREPRKAAILLGAVLLYLPTAGLVFPHRNFYSVRYLEPLLLYAWIFAAPAMERGFESARLRWVPLALLAIFLVAGISESETWARGENVFLKGLRLNPDSLMLKRQLAVAFDEDRQWGRLSATEMRREDEINRELKRRCLDEATFPGPDDCFSFWGATLTNYQRFDDATIKRAAARYISFVKRYLPERLDRLNARLKILYLAVGIRDEFPLGIDRYAQLGEFGPLPGGRFLVIAAYCASMDYRRAGRIRSEYLKAHLIDPVSDKVLASDLMQREAKSHRWSPDQFALYQDCLLGRNKQ